MAVAVTLALALALAVAVAVAESPTGIFVAHACKMRQRTFTSWLKFAAKQGAFCVNLFLYLIAMWRAHNKCCHGWVDGWPIRL